MHQIVKINVSLLGIMTRLNINVIVVAVVTPVAKKFIRMTKARHDYEKKSLSEDTSSNPF